MPVRSSYTAFGVLALMSLLLAGCGTSIGGTGPDSAAPTATATAPLQTPGKGATPMTGVTITTDRNSYTFSGVIRATATNRSGKTIYASAGKASCSIFDLEVKTAQGWRPATVAPCTRGGQEDNTSDTTIQIASGARHTADIAANDVARDASLPSAGTYRLALSYFAITVPPPLAAPSRDEPRVGTDGVPLGMRRAAATPSPATRVYSEAFEIR
jgi:hypothetical protein